MIFKHSHPLLGEWRVNWIACFRNGKNGDEEKVVPYFFRSDRLRELLRISSPQNLWRPAWISFKDYCHQKWKAIYDDSHFGNILSGKIMQKSLNFLIVSNAAINHFILAHIHSYFFIETQVNPFSIGKTVKSSRTLYNYEKRKTTTILLIFSSLLGLFLSYWQRTCGQDRPARDYTGTVLDGVTKTSNDSVQMYWSRPSTDSLACRPTVTDGQVKFENRQKTSNTWCQNPKLKFIGYVTNSPKAHNFRDPIDLARISPFLERFKKLLDEIVHRRNLQSSWEQERQNTTSFNAKAFKTQENAQAETWLGNLAWLSRLQGGQTQAAGEGRVQKY